MPEGSPPGGGSTGERTQAEGCGESRGRADGTVWRRTDDGTLQRRAGDGSTGFRNTENGCLRSPCLPDRFDAPPHGGGTAIGQAGAARVETGSERSQGRPFRHRQGRCGAGLLEEGPGGTRRDPRRRPRSGRQGCGDADGQRPSQSPQSGGRMRSCCGVAGGRGGPAAPDKPGVDPLEDLGLAAGAKAAEASKTKAEPGVPAKPTAPPPAGAKPAAPAPPVTAPAADPGEGKPAGAKPAAGPPAATPPAAPAGKP